MALGPTVKLMVGGVPGEGLGTAEGEGRRSETVEGSRKGKFSGW